MRRMANGLALVALALSGCGGAGTAQQPQAEDNAIVDETSLLRKVRNAAELETSLKAGVRDVPQADIAAIAVAAPARFSGTYTQEANVDEFDAVRFDGSYLYIAPQRRVRCCFIDPDPRATLGAPSAEPGSDIRILRADSGSATAVQVATIPLEADVSVQGLYVANGRAVALTSEAFYGAYGNFWSLAPYWAPSDFGLRIYDVSNPATPRNVFKATMDGVFVESRRIGDRIYVVSRYTPDLLTDPQRRAQVSAASLNELLPQVTIDGVKRPLVDPAQCFVTRNDPAEGYAVLTTITMFPLQNPAAFVSVCFNEASNGVYIAENALYLTQPNYAVSANNSRIHKFSLASATPTYQGSVEIVGAIWSGGQSDFRLSEHQGLLRVMTTEFLNDPADPLDHRLYVLRQISGRLALEIVSQLPNDSRPEEIGKPGENLYGVRFVGERAYAVTFRRIDPFYVLDLATPSAPRILGSVELPGYSDFLHPVTERLLLGLGESELQQLKLELFDVSVPDRPISRGAIVLGGRGSQSEARYDRHAFAYLADVAGVDRFALPTQLTADDGSYRLLESGLSLFEIHRKQNPLAATLEKVGAIVPRAPANEPPLSAAARNRAFISGDSVFYARDEQVWAASWLLPGRVNGPY